MMLLSPFQTIETPLNPVTHLPSLCRLLNATMVQKPAAAPPVAASIPGTEGGAGAFKSEGEASAPHCPKPAAAPAPQPTPPTFLSPALPITAVIFAAMYYTDAAKRKSKPHSV